MEDIRRLKVAGRIGPVEEAVAEVLVLGAWEGEGKLLRQARRVDERAGGRIKEALASGDFKGEFKETLLLYTPDGSPWRRILVVGLGKRGDITLDRVRQAIGTAARKVRDMGIKEGMSLLLGEAPGSLDYEDWVQAQVEAAALATHQFLQYCTKDVDKLKQLESWTLVEPDSSRETIFNRAVEKGSALAAAANYMKWLQGLPANHATPTFLAEQAKQIAKQDGYKCKVMGPDEIRKLGMGAMWGVAQGSDEPCRFIILEAKVSNAAPWIGIIGKGVTFDSGGLSLKPAAGMMEMKYDMSGAAAVLGLFKGLKNIERRVNIVGAIPAVENIPSAHSTKPGDIHTSYSGKTIEVLNTDAEGRLILADALTYVARTYEPEAMIDLATLTGAVVVALGHYAAALLSNDDELIEQIETAAERTGERVWQLPLWSEYREHLKSSFADIKNIGDSNAGAGTITAAWFLNEFVEDRKWAHIDIAGTAFWDRDRPYIPKGPSGYGVRLLADLIRHWEI
ncbi:MAG: leucyl aminopeptidase [Candidatus Eisenbacteria bacterium]|uniref:Probable cytosol aminopeptidase n=1 Tax=Eiseniibacteriota bacterium TaxID=2212470 RepID=A0A948RYU2_UNCEI|nr:leucyl aminopeptidase [Candidatus Eisenbacteria bacterium]MBU1950900.1 leucyl aminopeptidase [Candidatus Eisenbacteria bacterium]MBU2692128.1 leucyl aminopeptidase [Candidatus Eisenbacteria bacterium]